MPVTGGGARRARGGGGEKAKVGGGQDERGACIWALMDAVDSYIPTPVREVDKPFLMSVEDIFTITGRGTVATGRVERGRLKLGEEVELVGLRAQGKKTVATGIEMLGKMLDEALAGDSMGVRL